MTTNAASITIAAEQEPSTGDGTAGAIDRDAARPRSKSRAVRWMRGAGIAGFAFFFLKGVAWLVVFVIAAMKITGA